MVDDGEAAKTLATVEQLCRDFARFGLSRSDAVVALGGGVVSDVAGFAASVFHRGIAYVNVPTTLLAQVDAAIGGKTGVNLPEGKNLVGAFWQPAAVLCDIQTLGSLPAREWSSGRGEMAKYAFLGDGLLERGRPGAAILGLPLDEQVAACVAIKAAVVSADERESGRRMVLNYGHTLAHALEASLVRSRGEMGPAPRRGGRHRPRLRGPAGPAPRPHRRRAGGAAPAGGGRLRPLRRHPRGCLGARARGVHGPGQEGASRPDLRPRRARRGGAGARGGRGGRARHPGRHGVRAVSGAGRPAGGAAVGAQPRPAGRAPTRGLRHAPRSPTTWLPPPRRPARCGLELEHHQTNHEGELVELVHEARGRAAAVIVNAGALTHYSWSLHDALAAFDGVVVELHLSNPAAREPWRHTSVVAPVADGTIAGFGGLGYPLAVQAVARLLATGRRRR